MIIIRPNIIIWSKGGRGGWGLGRESESGKVRHWIRLFAGIILALCVANA